MKNRDFMGRAWIKFSPRKRKFRLANSEIVDIYFQPPKWFNVRYDATEEVCGKVMLAYTLIRNDLKDSVPQTKSIVPRFKPTKLNMFCIGLRDIDMEHPNIKPKKMKVKFDISGDESVKSQTTAKRVASEAININ